jgi:predicted amidophosphoribosyltransferase
VSGTLARCVAVVRRAARDVERLVLPVACPGCGTPDVRWCTRCLGVLHAPPRRCEDGAPRLDRLDGVPPLPVWTLADYAGGLRDVVVAWKDRGRADLDAPLSTAARRAGTLLSAELAGPAGAPGVLVAAAPTSRAARRARGRDPVAALARAFASGLAGGATDRVVPVRAAHVLAQRGRSRDQVGLGARARGARLGAVAVAPGPRARRLLAAGPAVVLVDDVLTTGATLAACETALARAGLPVLGAFVLAATPAPTRAGAATTPP